MFCLSDFSQRVHYFYCFHPCSIIAHHAAHLLFILAFLLPAVQYAFSVLFFSCYFLPLHFFFSLPHSVLASLTDQHATRHHTIPLANSTLTSTVPVLPPPCCLRAHAHFASLASFVCSSVRRTTVCRMLSGCRPISAGCRSSVSGGRGRFQPASELSSGASML